MTTKMAFSVDFRAIGERRFFLRLAIRRVRSGPARLAQALRRETRLRRRNHLGFAKSGQRLRVLARGQFWWQFALLHQKFLAGGVNYAVTSSDKSFGH